MNCFKCCQALYLKDSDGNMCMSAVYCPINGTIVDIDDVCCEYEER